MVPIIIRENRGSSKASSESPCGLSPDITELERFINSYVQDYHGEGWLNDVPNDADPERLPRPPILQEERLSDSFIRVANAVRKVCDTPGTQQYKS
uniref:Uncharacterized protein n=1 Tax=Eptatretus burgeri TaxID=7764 RepID=A0A8C4NK00_EPTBU